MAQKRMKRTKFKTNGKKSYPLKKQELPGITECKESMFVHEYLVDLDIVGAGIRSGLVSPNGTRMQQEKQATAVYEKDSVQAYLKQAVGHRVSRTRITEDKILSALDSIAFHDPIGLFTPEGDYRAMADIPPELRRVISEFEYRVEYRQQDGQRVPTGHISKIKLHDRMAAFKMLLQHNGLIGPDKAGNLNINYNQFNVTQNNTKNVTNQIDLSQLDDEELHVLRKMTGHSDSSDILDLQELEAGYYDGNAA